MMIGDK